jgi:hypothetical protein
MTSGYDRMISVLNETGKNHDELGDLMINFLTDYKYYGIEVNTNILQLNFPGCSDWCFFISVPDDKLKTFKKNLDEYPVYFIDFECGELKKSFSNYKIFIDHHFPKNKFTHVLSKKSIHQSMPKIRELSDKEE